MDAKIVTANRDLAAFDRGGPITEFPRAITVRMHALLVTAADALVGCNERSPEEAELAAPADSIEAYEALRSA